MLIGAVHSRPKSREHGGQDSELQHVLHPQNGFKAPPQRQEAMKIHEVGVEYRLTVT